MRCIEFLLNQDRHFTQAIKHESPNHRRTTSRALHEANDIGPIVVVDPSNKTTYVLFTAAYFNSMPVMTP